MKETKELGEKCSEKVQDGKRKKRERLFVAKCTVETNQQGGGSIDKVGNAGIVVGIVVKRPSIR